MFRVVGFKLIQEFHNGYVSNRSQCSEKSHLTSFIIINIIIITVIITVIIELKTSLTAFGRGKIYELESS